MINKIAFYMGYPFVRYALIVSVLVSLCASLLGVTLVLKRFSFIGDGLSHVAFGAMAVATALKMTNNMLLILPVTVASAVLILKSNQNPKVKGDAMVAMISVGSLAAGYMVMSLFSVSGNVSGDLCTTLFGSTSILTLTTGQVRLCVMLSAVVVMFFVLFYNKIFAITFDESVARATGVNTGRYNLALAVVTAVVIVLAMNLVGSLLISALIVFPALSAMQMFASFRQVTVCSAVLGVVCSVTGLFVSIAFGTPVGSTIVMADLAVFTLFYLAGRLRG